MNPIVSAQERKKAKEAYLAALEAQKLQVQSKLSPTKPIYGSDDKNIDPFFNSSNLSSNRNKSIDKRQETLEEKRREFLSKQQNNGMTAFDTHPLKNYEKEGHSSEYAYALAIGALEIPKQNNIVYPQHPSQYHSNERNDDLIQSENRIELNQNSSSSSINSGNVGINAIGMRNENRDSKRQQQQTYARELEQQIQRQNHSPHKHNSSIMSSNVMGINAIGFNKNEDKEMKRRQQEEYARELEYQIQQQQQQQQQHHTHHQNNSHNHSEVPGIDRVGEKNQNKDMKRQKQQEYAKELEYQMKIHDAKKKGILPIDDRYSATTITTTTTNNNHPITSEGILGIGGIDEKAMKRVKQREYAQSLLQQQIIQQSIQPLSTQSTKNYFGVHGLIAGSILNQEPNQDLYSNLGEGWVIGPLGIPVRKTLDVGDRKLQRLYNQHIQSPAVGTIPSTVPSYSYSSPLKQFSNNMGYPPQPPMYPIQEEHESYPNHPSYLSDNSNSFHSVNKSDRRGSDIDSIHSVNVGMEKGKEHGSGLPMDSQEERDVKQRMKKIEHQRALEIQVQEQKRRQQEEKDKIELEEKRMETRLEKERVEAQHAFEREILEAKIREEEKRKRELELQIDLKRRQQEDDKKKKQREDQLEDERIAREQEELVRKAKKEVIQERENLSMITGNNNSRSVPVTIPTPPNDLFNPLKPIPYSERKSDHRITEHDNIPISTLLLPPLSPSSSSPTNKQSTMNTDSQNYNQDRDGNMDVETRINKRHSNRIHRPRSRNEENATNTMKHRQIRPAQDNPVIDNSNSKYNEQEKILKDLQKQTEKAQKEALIARQELEKLRRAVEEMKVSQSNMNNNQTDSNMKDRAMDVGSHDLLRKAQIQQRIATRRKIRNSSGGGGGSNSDNMNDNMNSNGNSSNLHPTVGDLSDVYDSVISKRRDRKTSSVIEKKGDKQDFHWLEVTPRTTFDDYREQKDRLLRQHQSNPSTNLTHVPSSMVLDGTLESESRWLYPNGSSVNRIPTPNTNQYSTIQTNSSISNNSKEPPQDKNKSIFLNSISPIHANQEKVDIDRIFRVNRRKLHVMTNSEESHGLGDNLDKFIQDLQSVSSRPSTANSTHLSYSQRPKSEGNHRNDININTNISNLNPSSQKSLSLLGRSGSYSLANVNVNPSVDRSNAISNTVQQKNSNHPENFMSNINAVGDEDIVEYDSDEDYGQYGL